MGLRCLLFSSNEEMVQPIWQVLTDLGIEGEYCKSAVDAVEKVTTQVFQIVITDWDDQPEAGFLLKTARELKAAQRPLTLAIVSDPARLPEALQAGANSVLVQPIRAEQVRDTMSTACELLRARQQPAAQGLAAMAAQAAAGTSASFSASTMKTAAASAAASPAAFPALSSVASSVPPSVTQAPEKAFRAGEFLQSSGPAPGAQFDTDDDAVHKSMEQAGVEEVESLTELEPTAAAMEAAPEPEPEPVRQDPVTGWAALQARLMKPAGPVVEEQAPPGKPELIAYDMPPQARAAAAPPAAHRAEPRPEHREEERKEAVHAEPQAESPSEAALFAHIAGEPVESAQLAPASPSKLGRILGIGMLAACVALVAVPRTRQSLRGLSRNAARAGLRWLNPPPTPVPQAAPVHDSFGQSGDEYNLPAVANIPDATTDPSQIRVVPVIDPTAKKTDASNGQAATTGDGNPADQGQQGQAQPSQAQTNPSPTDQVQAGQVQAGQVQTVPNAGGQAQSGEIQVKENAPVSAGQASGSAPAAAQEQPSAPLVQAPIQAPAQTASSARPGTAPAGNGSGIPSSLQSQIGTTTPEASGTKPAEAAMSSIEPVKLPESVVLGLLAQPVDPVYPDAAKAGAQHGSVVLQVLIGSDGAVQDAKLLQGSLVFARAAIDAVKQWRFKPYAMNGRAVSVQSVVTLNFKPPA